MLQVNVNNIFFKSYSIDPISGHTIYVFDSTYLPEPEEVKDRQVYDLLIDELMDKLIDMIPCAPFSLVVFTSGFSQKKISWIYGVKMFSKLPKELRGFLQKTYIVHESFFIRTVYQVLSNAMNIKNLGSAYSFQDTKALDTPSMVHVSTLTELSQSIDITRLRISLNVYLHDYQIDDYIDVPQQYFSRLSPLGSRQYRQLVFDRIFKRLELEAPTTELIFQRPGSYKRVNILLDIIERNNYIDLSQWDIYSLASIFLHFLKKKSQPLIPIDLIPLPIKDNYQFTYETFCTIIKSNQYYDLLEAIFPLFISILDSAETTKHDWNTLSKALTPTLCKEKVSMMSSDRLAMGGRFIRNLFEYFPAIVERINTARTGRTKATSSTQSTADTPLINLEPPQPPRARKSSPTKYGMLERRQQASPSRSSSQQSDPERSISSSSTLFGDGTPVLKLREISSSVRWASDSTTTLSEDNNMSRSSSPSRTPEAIKQMVTDDAEKHVGKEDGGNSSNRISVDLSQLKLEPQHKIVQFDKNLQRQRILNGLASSNAKFSTEGYSDIKVGNKVGKLAALYEERLQGLQVLNEIKRNSG